MWNPADGMWSACLAALTRRGLLIGALGAAVARALAPKMAHAKKKKKITLCLGGQTIKAPKKKKKSFLKRGATPGICPPPPPPGCTPSCTGKVCGDDGCGESCGPCNPGETCPAGQCVCLEARVCGEVCCPEEVACFAEGCACEGFLCSCESGTFCSTPDLSEQCCLAQDTCDPQVACVAETCTVGNGVCSLGEAFCGDGTDCLCATSVDDAPFCADFASFTACPASSECTSDEPCAGAGETCVDIWCCAEDGSPLGICLSACPENLAQRAPASARARSRQRLQRILHPPRPHR